MQGQPQRSAHGYGEMEFGESCSQSEAVPLRQYHWREVTARRGVQRDEKARTRKLKLKRQGWLKPRQYTFRYSIL
jgi:hypothetical protein